MNTTNEFLCLGIGGWAGICICKVALYHCLRTIRQLRKWAWNDSSVSIHHEQPNPSPRILRISLRQTIQCKYTSKNEDRHLCVQLYGSSILSSAEGLFLRAKIKIQTLSLPNTFSQYSMRQWCMKTGSHLCLEAFDSDLSMGLWGLEFVVVVRERWEKND